MDESLDESTPATAVPASSPAPAHPPVSAPRGARVWPRPTRRATRRTGRTGQGAVLAAIAAGGAGGACLRYGAALVWPTAPRAFPWTTLWVNVAGCAAIGVLMVAVSTGLVTHPLVRPFLGVGVLGGFTTFSTYALDVRTLLADDRPALAVAYLTATMAGALAAVTTSTALTRLALRARRR
jgi:CrcB protein